MAANSGALLAQSGINFVGSFIERQEKRRRADALEDVADENLRSRRAEGKSRVASARAALGAGGNVGSQAAQIVAQLAANQELEAQRSVFGLRSRAAGLRSAGDAGLFGSLIGLGASGFLARKDIAGFLKKTGSTVLGSKRAQGTPKKP